MELIVARRTGQSPWRGVVGLDEKAELPQLRLIYRDRTTISGSKRDARFDTPLIPNWIIGRAETAEDTSFEDTSPKEQLAVEKLTDSTSRVLRRRTVFAILGAISGMLIGSLTEFAVEHHVELPLLFERNLQLANAAGIILIIICPAASAILNYLQFGSIFVTQSLIPHRARLGLSDDLRTLSAHLVSAIQDIPAPGLSNQMLTSEAFPEWQLMLTTNRLNREISDLGRRGNINLLIGILTTVVGISILGYVVYTSTGDGEDIGWKSGIHILLRVSIALFIQTFAYFFLRLYRTSLEDIKYYQNEITNIESELIARKAATNPNNDTLLKAMIESLAKTERNFILKKGDSTLGLERERLEKNEVIELVRDALGTVARLKPSR